MLEKDLREVMLIERSSFPSPWSEALFRQELLFFLSRSLVAEVVPEGIVGYLLYWLVAKEVHLHNLAVKSNWRRKGVASGLIREMMKRGIKEGATEVILEVRTSNIPAIKLYERFGFSIIGRRRGYYSDTGEDALIMKVHLHEEQENIKN